MERIGGFAENPSPNLNQAHSWVEMAANLDPEIKRFAILLRGILARCPVQDSRTWRSFAKVAMCRLSDSDVPMVVPGCMVQRAQGIDRAGGPVDEYLSAMPLPYLLVSLTAPEGVIRSRNKARGAANDRGHETPRSMALHQMAVRVVEKRGGRVLVLDTLDLVEMNGKRILDYARIHADATAS